MTLKVDYEWVCEEMDGDEIVEPHFADNREEALNWMAQLGQGFDTVALVYHLYCEVDGEQRRDYAYLDTVGKLPAAFPDGRPIPKRFF